MFRFFFSLEQSNHLFVVAPGYILYVLLLVAPGYIIYSLPIQNIVIFISDIQHGTFYRWPDFALVIVKIKNVPIA